MFQTVYDILYSILSMEKDAIKSGVNFTFPGWAQYLVVILGFALYLGFQVMLYLFMGFGLKGIYEKKGHKKTCFIWIPILQFYALIKAFGEVKIFNLEKGKYALYFLIVSLVYYITSFIIDAYYYAGDICYFLVHGEATLSADAGINDYVYYIFRILDLIYLVSFLGVIMPFFKERSPSAVWLTILCIFIPDIFPIYVFAFRKRQSQNFSQYKVVYTNPNYGRYENQGQNNTSTKVEEPFADFSEKKTDYSEPFADFTTSNTDTTEKSTNPSQDYSEVIKEDDEDLFN